MESNLGTAFFFRGSVQLRWRDYFVEGFAKTPFATKWMAPPLVLGEAQTDHFFWGVFCKLASGRKKRGEKICFLLKMPTSGFLSMCVVLEGFSQDT